MELSGLNNNINYQIYIMYTTIAVTAILYICATFFGIYTN